MLYKPYFILFLIFLLGLTGCTTRGQYYPDKVYYDGHYTEYSEPESDKKFDRYDLDVSYKVKSDELWLYVDPVDVYRQDFAQYAYGKRRYYKKHYVDPDLPTCISFTILVIPILIGNEEWRRECFGMYIWDDRTEALGKKKVGTASNQKISERKYRDQDGRVILEVFADGKRIRSSNLIGFKGSQKGALGYKLDWIDFGKLDERSSLTLKVTNNRAGKALVERLGVSRKDSELLVFKSKYDGAAAFMYVCEQCDRNMKYLKYYDHRHKIWVTNVFGYKGSDAPSRIEGCLQERFGRKGRGYGHTYVKTVERNTRSSTSRVLADYIDYYKPDLEYVEVDGWVSGSVSNRFREPRAKDLNACSKAKGLDLIFY